MENKLLAAVRWGDSLRDAVAKLAEIAVPPVSLKDLEELEKEKEEEEEVSAEEIRVLLRSRKRRRALFCSDLILLILSARRVGPHWLRPDWRARFRPIAEQAAPLRDSLMRLGERERARREIACCVETGGGIDLQALTGALDAVAKLGKALLEPPREAGQPKKSPFRPGSSAAEEFVAALDALVVQHGGERLTYYRRNAKLAGPLVEALDLLAPHLGKGFKASWTASVKRLGQYAGRSTRHARAISRQRS